MAMSVGQERLKENERALLQFWNMRRNGRAMPERADFTPEDLYPWIGFLHLLEPVDDGNDFRYAVFTTRTVIGATKDMTGKRVSDWQDERARAAKDLYGTVLRIAGPVYSAVPERHEDDMILYSRLCLPLGKGEKVTHIISMLTPVRDARPETIPPTGIEI